MKDKKTKKHILRRISIPAQARVIGFSRIPNDSPLKQIVTGYIWMGSVGEGYSPLMTIMPMAYRVWNSLSR